MKMVYTSDKEPIVVPDLGKFGQDGQMLIWLDSENGFDSNEGSQEFPIKTVERLKEMIPRYIDVSVTVLFTNLYAYRDTPFSFGQNTAIGESEPAFSGPGFLRFMFAPGVVQNHRPEFVFFNIKCELIVDNFDAMSLYFGNCPKVTIGSMKVRSITINSRSTTADISGITFDSSSYDGITADGNCFVRIYPTIKGNCSHSLFNVTGGARVFARAANIQATFGSYKIESSGGSVIEW